jgi:microcystin-dependent protein
MFVDPTIGNVTIFAGNFAPVSYMLCEGQSMSISNYTALYAIIGTIYGGDGVSTFKLPDMRNRVVVHAGQGPGLGHYAEGQVGGNNSITLLSSNLPVHTHTLVSFTAQWPVANSNGTQGSPVGGVPAVNGNDNIYSSASTATLAASHYNGASVIAGASAPISLQSPYQAMYYIIAVEGIFPSRN